MNDELYSLVNMFRCQEVFKGFGRRKLGFYQAHSRNKNPLHPSGFYALI